MGTQSILLFEEKAYWIFTGKYAPPDSRQKNWFFSFGYGVETDSPEQEAGRIELQTRLLYVYPLGFSSLKASDLAILPTQTCWNRKMHGSADRKMGLQAKERRAKITILPCSFRVSRLFYPLFGDIWVMGPQKICKTRFRTVTDRLSWW